MTYDWETDDEEANSTSGANAPKTFVGFVTNGISYVSFLFALVAFYQFFSPFLGTPAIGAVETALPTVVAPTENQDVIIDVAPAIAGVVATAVAIYLR